jgi:hypothetical protein
VEIDMSKYDETVKLAKDIASTFKSRGEFELNLDECGGYMEVGGFTVYFDENLEVTRTSVVL